MSYYQVLGLEKEPFSTSPDPGFFYQSLTHRTALANVLIESRLKRGLSIILGDIGTGKTTLSRKIFQIFSIREDIDFHMILDPSYDTEYLFLLSLIKIFKIEINFANPTILDLKEEIKRFLFQKGVNENKTTILLIDEAQKLNQMSLEVLRMLLNYETNEFKLLQLIVLGQMELLPKLVGTKNLMDRVSLKCRLGPFNEEETREMINFRIRQAGYNGSEDLFSQRAIRIIYEYTQGYPRRIAMLCHNLLKSLVMENKIIADEGLVRDLINREARLGWQKQDLVDLPQKNSY